MSGCIRTGPGPGSCTGRVALTKKPVHIPDVTADPEYSYPAVELARTERCWGFRCCSRTRWSV